ncbi:hypothetical protein J4413_04450 [Candidatus Woesearchaeota archaeon]|nr:hypothetical protein [Candidatus Woesearchaeota archaeon]
MADSIEDKKKKILGEPFTKYRLEIEEPGAGVERFYFWVLSFLQSGAPSGVEFNDVHKINDIYSSSEGSAYFGMIEQRKGLQQDKVSQYLATVGKMTKDLFQILRELRIIDERYAYYKDSKKVGEEGESAEVSLKSIWIDMVEGGAKNPTSVFGLSQQVGFVILPDLFFTVKVDIKEEDKEGMSGAIHKEVEKLRDNGINRKVREVLERKLYQYYLWRVKTEKEIVQRRNFMLKYLKQHYSVLRLYIHWIKPYLKNIQRLQMRQNSKNPNIIASFETSQIDIELIARKKDEKKDYSPCIRVLFNYVAIPQMAYQQEYQRGAIHTGRSIIRIESYALTDKNIKDYEDLVEEEDFQLIEGLNEAMASLGDELKSYLKEAGEKFKEDEKKKEEPKIERSNIFRDVFYGFGEIFGMREKSSEQFDQEREMKRLSSWQIQDEREVAQGDAVKFTYVLYDVFKKFNRMYTW